jgi:hypothetical protein
MKMLAIYPRFNSAGKSDATGAFAPKAREFLQVHGLPWTADTTVVFDNTTQFPTRMADMRRALRVPRPGLRTVAFFCHGWKDGIQAGYRSNTVGALAELLSRVCEGNCENVLLYACDNGRDADDDRKDDLLDSVGGDGGFADLLRDEFRRKGDPVRIFAHTKEGHTTSNPYVRVFEAQESFGGRFVIEPGSDLWGPWRRALAGTDLWARFPFLSRQELEAELRR